MKNPPTALSIYALLQDSEGGGVRLTLRDLIEGDPKLIQQLLSMRNIIAGVKEAKVGAAERRKRMQAELGW